MPWRFTCTHTNAKNWRMINMRDRMIEWALIATTSVRIIMTRKIMVATMRRLANMFLNWRIGPTRNAVLQIGRGRKNLA